MTTGCPFLPHDTDRLGNTCSVGVTCWKRKICQEAADIEAMRHHVRKAARHGVMYAKGREKFKQAVKELSDVQFDP